MAQDEKVARQLIRRLCRDNGVCTFLPYMWSEFYKRESGFCDTPQERDADHEDRNVPEISEFLLKYNHVFSFDEKSGGRCVEVRANIRLGSCKNFLLKGNMCGNARCSKLHCCGFYLSGSCKHGVLCRISHDLTTEHNANILRGNLVDGLAVDDLAVLIAARIPQICFPYNRNGCHAADKCRKMHVCHKFVENECIADGCNLNHDILSEQPRGVLAKYGLNTSLGANKVLEKLRSKLNITKEMQKQQDVGRIHQGADLPDRSRESSMACDQQLLDICRKNSSKHGCNNPNCPQLHICYRFLTSECTYGVKCKGGHDLTAPQPKALLMKFDYDVIEDGVDSVLRKLKDFFFVERKNESKPTKHGGYSSQGDSTPDTCSHYNRDKEACKFGERCSRLHVCRQFIMGQCQSQQQCYKSHDLLTEQAKRILLTSGLDVIAMGTTQTREKLKTMMTTSDASVSSAAANNGGIPQGGAPKQRQPQQRASSRSRSTEVSSCSLPKICPKYSYKDGCSDPNCKDLHICQHFIMGSCKFADKCKNSHNVVSDQSKKLFIQCGVNVADMTENQIKNMLREQLSSAPQTESSRGRTGQPAQPKEVPRTISSMNLVTNGGYTKICLFNLFGKCKYTNNDCYCYHSSNKLPYQWQWNDSPDKSDSDKSWNDFCSTANNDIENRFCDAAEKVWKGTDDNIGGEVRINFDSMTFGGNTLRGEVRRLGTESVAASAKRSRFTTVWVWYSQTDQRLWQAFPDASSSNSADDVMSSYEIESRYLANPDARISYETGSCDGIEQFLLDLKKMTQTNQRTQETYKIRRRPELYKKQEIKSANNQVCQDDLIRFPTYWDKDKMKDDCDDYVLIDVINSGKTADEYQKVTKRFAETMPGISLKTVKRIQNRDLWECFDTFKTRMNRRRTPPVDSMMLFHGTNHQYIDAICQQGFDWRLCGKSVGTAWGKGSYFARDASYSKSYTDCKTMFVVQVLVGDYTLGSSTYVRPPPRDPNKPHLDLYDSVVNDVQNPSIFVTFEKNQSYPEYLIEY